MNKSRQNILRKLIHKPNLSFNALWGKEGQSNKFAYHLKVLEEDGLIKKDNEKYQLSHEGKKYATYIEGETGKLEKFPLIGVIIVVQNKDNFLMMQRTKEPFYGYWGFHGGKLKFNQYILECAAQELKEETGFTCKLELKGIFSSKTFNNNVQSYNHQMFVIKATNPEGKLIEKNREGINKWINEQDIKDLNTFPNIQNSIDIIGSKSFKWVEADRIQENDIFKEIKLLKNMNI